MSRWAYPLCPDTNLLPDHEYTLLSGNVYQEPGIALARSCMIKRRTIIGKGTSLGDGSVVSNSVLGRRCQIGRNVTIDGAYIWDDAVIGDGTQVRQAIVANEAVVGNGCVIEPGALISFGVRISDGITISGKSRVTRARTKPTLTDVAIVGKGGDGYLWEDEDEDEDAGDFIASGLGLHFPLELLKSANGILVYNMAGLALSDASISTLNSEQSELPMQTDTTRADSFATSVSDEDGAEHFHRDAAMSIYDALQNEQGSDVVQLELVSLRMSANASHHQVRHAIAVGFMRRIQSLIDSKSVGASDAVKQVFTKYKELVERTVFDKEDELKVDQVDLLVLIQKELVHRPKGAIVLLFTAKELYDLEVIDAEAFGQWWDDERSSSDEDMIEVRKQAQQFVEWLENAEESSEEEEDDDEGDDDED